MSVTFGTRRTRFAWRPVSLWRISHGYVERTGEAVWLRRVVEMMTAYNGWTAYEHIQVPA